MVMKKTAGLQPRSMVETNQISDLQSSAALRAATWAAGTPLAITAAGYTTTTATGTDFFAIACDGWDAYNDPSLGGASKVEGTNTTGNFQIMTLRGQFRALISGETVNGVMTYSFARTPTSGTWAVGDEVFIAANLWNNTTAGTAAVGIVTQVNGNPALADSLEIQFNTITI